MKDVMKKNNLPDYFVDLTNCETGDDVAKAFVKAKLEYEQPLSEFDIDIIKAQAVTEFVNTLVEHGFVKLSGSYLWEDEDQKQEVKKPWYKRFWNWMLGRK